VLVTLGGVLFPLADDLSKNFHIEAIGLCFQVNFLLCVA